MTLILIYKSHQQERLYPVISYQNSVISQIKEHISYNDDNDNSETVLICRFNLSAPFLSNT